MKKIKIFFTDYWHLLLKSSFENHLRIQECKKQSTNTGLEKFCNLDFGSYSQLKRYQKKARLFAFGFSSTAMLFFIVTVSSISFLPSHSPVSAAGEIQITTDPNGQNAPDIDGGRIVWQDSRHGNPDIYMYDLSTNIETRITTDSSEQSKPSISGDKIVWQDRRNGMFNMDVYMYNITTQITTQITSNNVHQLSPVISGNRIVWFDLRHGNWDIYMYDLSTNIETRITTDPSIQDYPDISGDKIVWPDYRNGNWDIYMYDISTNIEKRITTDPSGQFRPSISGDKIVFEDNSNGNDSDVYLYDLGTQAETKIILGPSSPYGLRISGDKIVFDDYRNENDSDIYIYDLVTQAETQVTTNSSDQYASAISGDIVIWEDYRNGNPSIYMVDVSPVNASCGIANNQAFETAPITNLCTDKSTPTVNGSGPWTWVCRGENGGSNAGCSAQLASNPTLVNGICGTAEDENHKSKPKDNLCSAGNSTEVSSDDDKWEWSCQGANGGSNSSCKADREIDGKCGKANNDYLSEAPRKNLCEKGEKTKVKGDGPWTWKCEGENGGSDDECEAKLKEEVIAKITKKTVTTGNPIDGACGFSDGKDLDEKPSIDLCNMGAVSSISGDGPWSWECQGENEGTNANCKAQKTQAKAEVQNNEENLIATQSQAAKASKDKNVTQENISKKSAFVASSAIAQIKEIAKTQQAEITITLAEVLGIAAVAAVASATTASTSTGFSLLRNLTMGMVGLRKKRRWGTVFDSETKVAIDRAKIEIFNVDGKMLDRTMTDKDGRFGFLLPRGAYQISVIKNRFIFPSAKETQQKDEVYGNIYNGGILEIDTDQVIDINIPVDSEIDLRSLAERRIKRITSIAGVALNKISNALFYAGFVFSVGMHIFSPTKLNMAFLATYGLIIAYNVFSKKTRAGVLLDESTKKPVPFARINIFDSSNQKKGFIVTDMFGRYYDLMDNGKYAMEINGTTIDKRQISTKVNVNVDDNVLNESVSV